MSAMQFLVRGFHGTSRSNARSILSEGFDLQRSNCGYFGHGIYFFEENAERAERWSGQHHASDPAVLVAQLDLTSDGLDLTQRPARERFIALISRFENLDALLEAAGHPAGIHDDFVDAVTILLLRTLIDLKWLRVLVFDRTSAYQSRDGGLQHVSLPAQMAEAGARTRVVRNVQCQVAVFDTGVIRDVRLVPEAGATP